MKTNQTTQPVSTLRVRRVAARIRGSFGFARCLGSCAAALGLLVPGLGAWAQSSTATLTIVGPPTVDANGVQYYDVESAYQGMQDQTIRVLQPTNPAPGQPPRILFVLPVDQGVDTLDSTWSDGLEELRLLDVQDTYNMTLIAPSFNYNPWYGDNVTDPTLRMESFVLDDLVPFADAFAQGSVPQRYLIGFSKSGNGVLDLMFRHPSVFNAGAAWDAPAQQSSLSASSDLPMNFGTQANYNNYYIPGLVTSNAASFTQQNRLWISGDQAEWTADMDALNTQMNTAGIPHTWVAGPERDHSWGSGWLAGAVSALAANATLTAPYSAAMAPARTGGMPESLPYGSTQTTLSLHTDQKAACRYGTTAGVAYSSMTKTFSITGDTAHATLLSGLAGGSLTYYVRCQDAASGVVNPDDYAITFTIATSSGGNGAVTTPSVSVSASPSSITTVQGLQVSVALNGGKGNPTPTGWVTVSGGGYTSPAAALSGGSAILSIGAGQLSVGNDTLTAIYTPDASSPTYNSASGTALVKVTQASSGCTTPNPNPNPNPAAFAEPADFNGDCRSDILWQNTSSGQVYVWLMNGATQSSSGSPGSAASPWTIVGFGDFDGDGKADILWRNSSTGQVYIWLMNGSTLVSAASPGTVATVWSIVGVGDFDGDGKADILWRNSNTGQVYIWLMNGTTLVSSPSPGTVATVWAIEGIGDFNGDGKADILWQNTSTGQVYIWLMNGSTLISSGSPGTVGAPWTVQGIGDFDGDGRSDIVWRSGSSGQVYLWFINGTTLSSSGSPGTVASPWAIAGVGDFDGDGKADLLWRNTSSGQVYVWLMNWASLTSAASPGTVATAWQITMP